MQQIEIHLPKSDCKVVEALRSKGLHPSREINRAHILAALAQQLPDKQIGAVLGVSRKVIWRTRSAYREKGLDYALRDARRSGAPRKYRPDQAQAEVAAVACSQPPPGCQAMDCKAADRSCGATRGLGRHQSGERAPAAKKNVLKPWRKAMWCVGKITGEYRQRMYALLELYARPYDSQEPVICVDEKSKQLLKETRVPVPARPGSVAKQDYEYERAGTCNLFMSVEPKGQRRHVQVTARRTKVDFVRFVGQLVEQLYAGAKKLHLVLDNLNTHFAASFEEVLGLEAAAALLAGVEFHYTPKHASWLNMAELEIGIMEKQCTGRRMSAQPFVAEEVTAWEHRRNVEGRGISWTFTREKADEKLGCHYVT